MTDSGAERAARRVHALCHQWAHSEYPSDTGGSWQVEKILAIIQEETGTQWISVSTGIPAKGRYLVAVGLPTVHIAELWPNLRGELRWFRDGSNADITNNVTHYAALPPAPEEGGTK